MRTAKIVLETIGDLLNSLMTYNLIDLPSVLLLWHTENLPIHPVGIALLLLSQPDELVSHPKEIETILQSYG